MWAFSLFEERYWRPWWLSNFFFFASLLALKQAESEWGHGSRSEHSQDPTWEKCFILPIRPFTTTFDTKIFRPLQTSTCETMRKYGEWIIQVWLHRYYFQQIDNNNEKKVSLHTYGPYVYFIIWLKLLSAVTELAVKVWLHETAYNFVLLLLEDRIYKCDNASWRGWQRWRNYSNYIQLHTLK